MDLTQHPRLKDKVAFGPEDACWQWLAYKNPAGYGQIRVEWKGYLAHRYVYSLLNGEIPESLIILHSCDNPGCVNPKHLLLGTHMQNVQDKMAKGRGNTGERNGSTKLTDVQVTEIRRLYETGKTQSELGRAYGVNRSCIFKIVNHRQRKAI